MLILHLDVLQFAENGLAESCTKEDGSLQQSPLGSAEAETHSLDRHLFGLTWHRSSTKSHRSRAGTDFVSWRHGDAS